MTRVVNIPDGEGGTQEFIVCGVPNFTQAEIDGIREMREVYGDMEFKVIRNHPEAREFIDASVDSSESDLDRGKSYLWNLGEAISQAFAAVFGLNANLTFSAYCGHWQTEKTPVLRHFHLLPDLLFGTDIIAKKLGLT